RQTLYVICKRLRVLARERACALLEAAVYEDLLVTGVEEKVRAGHAPCPAVETDARCHIIIRAWRCAARRDTPPRRPRDPSPHRAPYPKTIPTRWASRRQPRPSRPPPPRGGRRRRSRARRDEACPAARARPRS